MKSKRRAEVGLARVKRLVQGVAVAGLCAAAGVSAGGCDTVAEISFAERNFFRVSSPGPAYLACGETASDSQVELRFLMYDDLNQVIRYNDRIEGIRAVNETTMAGAVSFEDGRIYSETTTALVRCDPNEVNEEGVVVDCLPSGGDRCVPLSSADQLGISLDANGQAPAFCRRSCTVDGDCAGGQCAEDPNNPGFNYCTFGLQATAACQDSSDCPTSSFTCCSLDAQNSSTCEAGTGLNLCLNQTETNILPGGVRYVSPRTESGAEPARAVALVMDNSGSLSGKTWDENSIVDRRRATDPSAGRISAMQTFFSLLDQRSYKEATVLSLWSFNGTTAGGVVPRTGDIASEQVQPFVLSTNVLINKLSELRSERDAGRSNVFLAVKEVAENFKIPEVADREKVMILFTDGPDDSVVIDPGSTDQLEAGRTQWQQRFNEALASVTEDGNEVQVFIVHLDTGLTPEGVAALQPDPRNAVPYPLDAQGRTGPIDEYAQIACATGGNYIYATAPEALSAQMRQMVDMIGSMWAIEVEAAALDGVNLPNGAYRLGGTLSVTLQGNTDSFALAPLGAEGSATSQAASDSRGVLFKRDGTQSVINLGGAPGNVELRPLPANTE